MTHEETAVQPRLDGMRERVDVQLRFDGTPEPRDLPEPADPRIVPCRDCGQRAGTYCKRPSGHKAMGYHASRVRDAAVAEDADDDGR